MKLLGTELVQREIEVSIPEAWQGIVHTTLDAAGIPRGSFLAGGEIALPGTVPSDEPDVRFLQTATEEQKSVMKALKIINRVLDKT